MKRVIIGLALLLLSSQSFAQNHSPVDSLLSLLSESKEDTTKVVILLKLFNPTVVNDLDLAYEYTDQAHVLSEKLSFDKGIAAAYQRKGIIWGYRGNVDKARENYLKAIEVHKRLDTELIAATLVFNLGLLYKEQGIFDSALVYNQRANEVFLSYNDSLKYASCMDLFSSIHLEKGNYYLSVKYAMEAAGVFRFYGDELREADALIKIGQGYVVQENYRSAIDYFKSANALYRKHNDKIWENYGIQKIGMAYLKLNLLSRADSTINYSIQLSDSLGSARMMAAAYEIKGEILYSRGKYKEAMNYFKQALEINTDAQDSTFIATAHISIGRCHQQLGNYDLAEQAYLKVLPISLQMEVKENQQTIYLQLSEIYGARNNTALSYDFYKKSTAVKDSIYQQEKLRQFADMQTKYDTEKKERELALQNQKIVILEQEAEIQDLIRMRLIVSIIVVVLVFALVIYAQWLRVKKNKLKQAIENERLNHELDLKKRELATHTLHIIQKNELLENLQNKVYEIGKQETGTSYREITRLIKTNRLIEKDWENFKSVFEQVHPDFFAKLKNRYESISSNELRMAAMMKMNLNTKEMASILNITPESVKKARYRMRKKLELKPESNVNEYLMNF